MKHITLGALALATSSTSALALGLDRSAQDITAMFEPGGYVELSYGFTQPSLTGSDLLGNQIDNVGVDHSQVALAFKMDFGQNFSFGLIIDQPYGADIAYGGNPVSTMFGGTLADLDTRAITAIGRYRFNDTFSVHAGVRQVTMDGEVTLSGLAFDDPSTPFPDLSGYNVQLQNGEGTGWLAGAAYERPDIALRVALTYHSEVETTFDTVETYFAGTVTGTTTVLAPEAWNLDFQTGVATDTLVFGTIRYAAYADTILSPDFFNGATSGGSITDIESSTAYTLGVARRFTDAFGGSLSVTYEPASDDDLVSPLAPINGLVGITLGGRYTMDAIELSGGIRYTMLGDAFPETGTPDVARGEFTNNDALSVGLSVAYRF